MIMSQRVLPERHALTVEIANNIDPKKIILAGISSFGAIDSSLSVVIHVVEGNQIRSYVANARNGFDSDKAYSLIGATLFEEKTYIYQKKHGHGTHYIPECKLGY